MVRQNRGVINEGTLVMNGASSIHNTLYGVTNSGSMTMNDSSVSDGVENSGTLTLNDDSRSGVVNEGTATLNDHSTLGGAYNGPGSRLTMNDASQITNGRDDHAPGVDDKGVINSGTLVLNGTSQISYKGPARSATTGWGWRTPGQSSSTDRAPSATTTAPSRRDSRGSVTWCTSPRPTAGAGSSGAGSRGEGRVVKGGESALDSR